MQSFGKYYVYVHRYASGERKGDVFYVGKGINNRHLITYGRNRHWVNITKRYGYTSDIIKRFKYNECALTYEMMIIKLIGRDRLCNLTAGGEGSVNPSDETRSLMRKRKLGVKQSHEHALKSRRAKIGKKQPDMAVQINTLAKSIPIINSKGEVFPSASCAARVIGMRSEINASQGNISSCARGERNNAYGYTWSYDVDNTPEYIPTAYRVKKILLVCKGISFDSVQDAVKYISDERGSANNQCISQAARRGTRSYGYKWKYI